MKFKTGEKLYGGIILGFLALIVIRICRQEGDKIKIEVKNNISGKTDIVYGSKGKFALVVAIFYLIVFLAIGGIARYFVNRGDKRERDKK